MVVASTSHRLRNLRWLPLGSALLLAACGGKSAYESYAGSGGTGASDATGGATTSGGSGGTSTGGDTELGGSTSTGGNTSTGGDTSTGGNTEVGGTTSTGGDTSTGGTAGDAGAGAGDTSSGGTGGSAAASGAGGSPNCNGVVCAPIPKTCKQIVQDPGACCPTCPDTGCDICPDLVCAAGTHAETKPGDCCPTCQPDADAAACMMGQAAYQSERASLIDKYGSSGCKNSTDCGIAKEQNACASTCGVALPVNSIKNFENNTMNAGDACSTCPPPPTPQCPASAAACVNGECTLELVATTR